MQFLQSIKTALQSRLYFFIIFPAIVGFYLVLQALTPLSWSSSLLISWNIAIYAYLLLTIKNSGVLIMLISCNAPCNRMPANGSFCFW